jgi:hypothetical protein
MFAVTTLSLVPVRKEPSDKSEMVNQLLFGDTVEIVDEMESWKKVKQLFDDYEGWVDKKQLTEITDEQLSVINSSMPFVCADLFQIIIWNKNQISPIVMGSSLPLYNNHKFYIGSTEYSFDGSVTSTGERHPEKVLEQAYMYLNAPYLWGGRSPLGIDCSGLTQMAFKLCGMKLKRDAWQQAEQGTTINQLSESRPGDLAFFRKSEGKITHVGIILPANRIIHASGKVRIDKIDPEGILNEESGEYTHSLGLIKRLF